MMHIAQSSCTLAATMHRRAGREQVSAAIVALHTASSGAHNLTGAKGSTVEVAEGDAAANSPVS